MKIFYHNDADGQCAAAIALRYYPQGPISFQDIELIEMDYKDKVNIESIQDNELIIIVDFSFKPEVMNQILLKTTDIIWLDHHETAFKYETSYLQNSQIGGIRSEEYAGCELAWRYFRQGLLMPRAVELIGDYDKWSLKFQPECFEFYEGLKMEDTTPVSEIWAKLFEQDGWVESIINRGRVAIKYRDNYCEKMCEYFGYETEIDGYKAFACNIQQFGSKAFGDRMDKYPVCIAYAHDGNRFTVSLYSAKGIKVNEICERYGGGGHPGAAGFVNDLLPFKRVGENK